MAETDIAAFFSRQNRFANICLICSLILLTLTIFSVVPFVDRGFDVSDEGYNLIRYRYPNLSTMMPHFEHVYLGPLFRMVNYDLPTFRFVGIFLLCVSSLFFAISVARFLKPLLLIPLRTDQISISITLFSGSLLYYVWFILTPNYNWLTAVQYNLSLALLFLGLTQLKSRQILFFLAGTCAAVAFFGKFSASIFLLVGEVLFLFFLIDERKKKLKSVSILAAGFSCWMFIHFLLINSVANYFHDFNNSLTTLKLLRTGHGLNLLGAGIFDLKEVFLRGFSNFKGLWVFTLAFALPLIAGSWLRRNSLPLFFFNTYFLLTLGFFAFRAITLNYHLGGSLQVWNTSDFYAALLLMSFFHLLVTVSLRKNTIFRPSRESVQIALCVGGLFTILPYCMAVGTARGIFLNTILYMNPWFGIFILVWITTRFLSGSRLVLPTYSLFTVFFVWSQVTSAQFEPMRISTEMRLQIEPVEIGNPPSRIKVDIETKKFFDSLQRLAKKADLKSGQDVIVFFDMPGLNFVIGTKSPGLAWYSYGYPGSVDANIFGLKSLEKNYLEKVPILESSRNFNEIKELTAVGLNFPGAYEFIGEAHWMTTEPTVYRLWKPRIESVNSSEL